MKKILLFVIVACLSIQLQAQGGSVISSHSSGIRIHNRSNSKTINYVRGGFNFMSLTGDGMNNIDVSKKLGYNFVYGFQKPMGTIGMYWGMDFGFGSRGYKSEKSYTKQFGSYYDPEYVTVSTNTNLIAYNLQVSPFTLGWRHNIIKDVDIDLHAGIFASYDLLGTLKLDISSSNSEYISSSLGDWQDWNEFDVGLNIGFGGWYRNFNLDFTFQKGFIENYPDCYANNFMIRFGIAF